MKSLIETLTLLNVALLSQLSFSGHDLGNGGNLVVCDETNNPFHNKIYDQYEAVQVYDFTPDTRIKGEGYSQIVESVLKRLESLDAVRATRYLEQLKTFESETQWEQETLGLLPDQGIGVVPRDCELQQIALQRRKPQAEQKRYIVDEILWKKLSPISKAWLVLHEIITREKMRGFNADKSTLESRHYNGLLFSRQLRELTQQQYDQLLIDLNFRSTSFKNLSISLPASCKTLEGCDIQYWNDGQLFRSGLVHLGSVVDAHGNLITLNTNFIEVSPEGVLQKATANLSPGKVEFKRKGILGDIAFSNAEFSKEGQLEAIEIHNLFSKNLSLKVGDIQLSLSVSTHSTEADLTFHSNGMIKSALVSSAMIENSKGTKKIASYGRLYFSPEGSLLR